MNQKKMTPEKWQQFNMLQDVITHFSQDPVALRSVGTNGGCYYNPPKNKPESIGCAIGMYIPEQDAKKLDNTKSDNSVSITEIIHSPNKRKFDMLPEWMKQMDEDFLGLVQALHDYGDNWADNTISETGIDLVKTICKNYNLPFRSLKFKQ